MHADSITAEHDIYQDSRFRDVDIGEIMRQGHPGIEDGDRHILNVVRQTRERLGRSLRILDVGSGSGHLSLMLARQLPDSSVIANEIAAAPVAQARAKLKPFENAQVFDQPFEQWGEPVDVIISWGTHHHLKHDYLQRIEKIVSTEGCLIIGDEFCPEYLTPSDQERIARASHIVIEGGFIFDNEADLHSYRQTGVVPPWNQKLEEARRRALWTWYKYVGDYAVASGVWMVLITELQIARDDLITEFAEESKTSPFLLERELHLNGFNITNRAVIGDAPPELQSFIVYTCQAAVRRK